MSSFTATPRCAEAFIYGAANSYYKVKMPAASALSTIFAVTIESKEV